jgi:hypothetical protein
VVGWLPATAGDAALWHVVHADGDEEDLEEHELTASLVAETGTEAETEPVAGTEATVVEGPVAKEEEEGRKRTRTEADAETKR